MIDPASLTPDERKRFYADLRQDEEYRKNRKSLLTTTLMAAGATLIVMLLMFTDLVPQWLVVVDLVLIVVFQMYFAFRSARRQNEIIERFRYYWNQPTKKKKKEMKAMKQKGQAR